MSSKSLLKPCFSLLAVGFLLLASDLPIAAAGDVLSPAHCKTAKDFKEAHSQFDASAWDMYTVGGLKLQVNGGNELLVTATFNFSKCAQLSPGLFDWRLFNEARKTTVVVLVGEEAGWFGISHIHPSAPGSIDLTTGRGTASFGFAEFMNDSQKSAWANLQTVRDLQVVLIADQNNSAGGGYTPNHGISSEGVRLSFDLVYSASAGYKAVLK